MIFLDWSCNILCCVGIFSSSSSSKWTLWVYRAIVLAVLSTANICMAVQLFLAPDLSLLARTIDMWTLFLSGTYKWFYMTMFSEEFANLNKELVKIQAHVAEVYGQATNQFTANYMKQSKPFYLWYMFSGMIAVTLVIMSSLITFPKNGRSEFNYFNDPKSYPFSLWIPFIIEDYWAFFAFFALQCVSGFLITSIFLGIDTFMFGAIYAIAGQIDLLNSAINKIENSTTADQNLVCVDRITYLTEKDQDLCYSTLRECSKHHILIHNYIKKISTEFSSMIIVDYLHGITSLTFALFQLSISNGIGESMSVIFFIFLSIFHQFLNNFFGEYIVQKQFSVGLEAYDVPWWRVNKKSRYLLTLMILRSNKPTLITGFYMYKLCNVSFIVFVKALYSYYMVLRRVNIEE